MSLFYMITGEANASELQSKHQPQYSENTVRRTHKLQYCCREPSDLISSPSGSTVTLLKSQSSPISVVMALFANCLRILGLQLGVQRAHLV